MPNSEPIHTLLATLGGQPQVITFTLDLLLARGIPIREVIVVHPATYDRLQDSIACLNAEFPGDRYKQTGQLIRFRRHVLQQYNRPIHDITDNQSASEALNAMDELIHSLKKQQRIIHFSISGGRRLIGYLSFSAALLNFGPADQLWHIHTPRAIKQLADGGKRMHVDPDAGVRLIEVPFARLAQPILSRLLSNYPDNSQNVISTQAERETRERHAKCRMVVEEASPAQRKVLRAFARGLHPQQVADEMDRTIATISTHTNHLFSSCRNIWNIPENRRLDYRFLHQMFGDYFVSDE
jgi:CRISPR-associated protein Csx14